MDNQNDPNSTAPTDSPANPPSPNDWPSANPFQTVTSDNPMAESGGLSTGNGPGSWPPVSESSLPLNSQGPDTLQQQNPAPTALDWTTPFRQNPGDQATVQPEEVSPAQIHYEPDALPANQTDIPPTVTPDTIVNPDSFPATQVPSENSSAWNEMPSNPEPVPTFTPPPLPTENIQTSSQPLPDQNTASTPGSPSETPWGTTTMGTAEPKDQNEPANPSWSGIPATNEAQAAQTPPLGQVETPTEAGPTDLSHLITNNRNEQQATTPGDNPFVSSTPVAPEVPSLPKSGKPMPKWILAAGGLLLVVVIGASAYFILGIGRPTETTSIPAVTEQQDTQTNTAAPQPSAETSSIPDANSSSNFGELQGSSGNQVSQGTSAAELLRQRQLQQGR